MSRREPYYHYGAVKNNHESLSRRQLSSHQIGSSGKSMCCSMDCTLPATCCMHLFGTYARYDISRQAKVCASSGTERYLTIVSIFVSVQYLCCAVRSDSRFLQSRAGFKIQWRLTLNGPVPRQGPPFLAERPLDAKCVRSKTSERRK